MTPEQTVPPECVQATFAATLVDEWVRCGVTEAVIAPGSRSTPLVLALANHGGIRTHVQLDERSAAFMALGLGLATGRPAIVVTTSGTAAAHLHPAILESHHARVPLIACTADRPPHLHHVAAPQTIEQGSLYGRALRWAHEPGLAVGVPRHTWRSLAARAYHEATSGLAGAGPVHLNLAFDEPLVAEAGGLPPARNGEAAWFDVVPAAVAPKAAVGICRGSGVIIAGRGCGSAVGHMSDALGWPVLADARSGVRGTPNAVAAFDPILRVLGGELRPDVVVRVGDPPASKVLATWLASLDEATHVLVDPNGVFADPDRTASVVLRATPEAACRVLANGGEAAPVGWLHRWRDAETAAQHAIDEVLLGHPTLSEPAVARVLTEVLRGQTVLLTASSMPVRDVEWFGHPHQRVEVVSNRGANGIDGLVSTAVGIALSGRRTVAHLGDLAFLHDANGLLGLRGRDVACTFVVVDNSGGGIFSFLPQAGGLSEETFERFFGTPQPVNIPALAAAHGLETQEIVTVDALQRALASDGVSVVVVPSNRAANVAIHEELNGAVAAALSAG